MMEVKSKDKYLVESQNARNVNVIFHGWIQMFEAYLNSG
jgi:hypothetical protein